MRNIKEIDIGRQGIVSALCDMAEKDPVIKRIIIFSPTANNRSDDSDFSICYELLCSAYDVRAREIHVSILKICGYDCDIVCYNLAGSKLRSEVDSEGVTVYERKN